MSQPADTVIGSGSSSSEQPIVWAGTGLDLAAEIHEQLCEAGYSLSLEDVEKRTRYAVRFWSGWAVLAAQRELAAGQAAMLDDLNLTAFEYSQIKPLARAYCDELQAIRMEAARGLGIEPWGVSVQEATMAKERIEQELPRTAFVEGPYSVTIAGDILPSVTAQQQRAQARLDQTGDAGWWYANHF